jgi:hypothetical protein
MQRATASGDKVKTRAALFDLEAAITAAETDVSVWEDIFSTISMLTRTAESERKREVDAQYMIKVEEMLLFVSALAGILKETIADKKQLNVIQGKVQELLEAEYGKERE